MIFRTLSKINVAIARPSRVKVKISWYNAHHLSAAGSF